MYYCKALNFNRGVLHTRNSQCFKARFQRNKDGKDKLGRHS